MSLGFIAGFGIGFVAGVITLGIIGYVVLKRIFKTDKYIELNERGRIKKS